MLRNDLDYRSVISRLEFEEYSKCGDIRPWLPKDPRHKTFHLLKHGHRKTYKGDWGPELLVWDPLDNLGYVWTTNYRANEIRNWIMQNLFQ